MPWIVNWEITNNFEGYYLGKRVVMNDGALGFLISGCNRKWKMAVSQLVFQDLFAFINPRFV